MTIGHRAVFVRIGKTRGRVFSEGGESCDDRYLKVLLPIRSRDLYAPLFAQLNTADTFD